MSPKESCIIWTCILALPGKYNERLCAVAMSESAARSGDAAYSRIMLDDLVTVGSVYGCRFYGVKNLVAGLASADLGKRR